MSDDQQPLSIRDAPAPWRLTGDAYIVAVRANSEFLTAETFLPASLQESRRGNLGYLMFVDYSSSDVGPYHELLFIPGHCRFADGQRHLTISRIFVSSMDSVVNGQRNWGIPKDVASFNVHYNDDGIDRVEVHHQGQFMARLAFRAWPLSVPVFGQIVPSAMRTLAQHCDGKTFVYAPSANGLASPARLLEAEFNSALFPDIARQNPLLCVRLKRFRMRFPVATIIDHL